MVDKQQIYYAGEDSTENRNRVGIIVTSEVNETLLGFMSVSDRVAMIKSKARPCNKNVIQVYVPNARSSEE